MSTNLDGAVAACGGGGSDLEYLNTFLTPQFLSTDIPATLSRGFINDGSITCCAQFSNFEDENHFFLQKALLFDVPCPCHQVCVAAAS